VTSSDDGALRIDFHHSSLFGAIEEDATLVVRDSLVIYDGDGRRVLGADSSLAMLRECVGAAIEPEDIRYVLLLDSPPCRELEGPACTRKGSKWRLEALWRGRRVEWDGNDLSGVTGMRQRFPGGEPRYTVEYEYGKGAPAGAFPKRIRLVKEGSGERAVLEVSGASRAAEKLSSFGPAGAAGSRSGGGRASALAEK